MLVVLGLIDVVMISNLLIMVIVGGYETFVSRLELEGHPDQPEWLSHVNASVLKIKLAMAIIGISSIHLLRDLHRGRRARHGADELHQERRDVADDHPLRVHPVGDRHRLGRSPVVDDAPECRIRCARPSRRAAGRTIASSNEVAAGSLKTRIDKSRSPGVEGRARGSSAAMIGLAQNRHQRARAGHAISSRKRIDRARCSPRVRNALRIEDIAQSFADGSGCALHGDPLTPARAVREARGLRVQRVSQPYSEGVRVELLAGSGREALAAIRRDDTRRG